MKYYKIEAGLTAAISLMFVGALRADEPVVVACNFEYMQLMLFTFRGGMGADNNTLQVGQNPPVELSVGSSLMGATDDMGATYSFSLAPPANVTVVKRGASNGATYHGECVSSLQR